MRRYENLSNEELVLDLRRAAEIWFKNDDLLLLEELIYRYKLAGSLYANLGEPSIK